jgi:nicotinamidase-related amidase
VNPPDAAGGSLLLCLDMQPVFVRAVARGDVVLRRCQFAVAAARGLGMRVAFTEQVPRKLGATDPSLLALAGTPEVHEKETFSALSPGGRLAGGPAARFSHLFLCGVETPVCVYQTAVDALGAGLAVTVLSDCVGARRAEDARACLEALARDGARVLPAETLFYTLLGGASHPFFRDFTSLVKKYA